MSQRCAQAIVQILSDCAVLSQDKHMQKPTISMAALTMLSKKQTLARLMEQDLLRVQY